MGKLEDCGVVVGCVGWVQYFCEVSGFDAQYFSDAVAVDSIESVVL